MIAGCTSHTCAVPSWLPLRSHRPSSENATDQIKSWCPINWWNDSPVSTFHNSTLLSPEPLARYLLSGEKDSPDTFPEFPTNCRTSFQVVASQSHMVFVPATAIYFPSGE